MMRTLSALVEHLPRGVRLGVKTRHYARLVRSAQPEIDPDLAGARRLVKQGDAVLDVGANVGMWTRFLSEWVGARGHVWSFEPVPETFGILSRCARGRRNVTLLNFAVSDHGGEIRMRVPIDSRGIRNYHLASVTSADDSRSFAVRAIALDDWRADNPDVRIGFLKIDVEGHELECICGAFGLIGGDHPAICVEISSDPAQPGSEGAAVVRILMRLGYRAYCWNGDSFAEWNPGQGASNYFFLRPEHLASAVVRPN